MDDKAKQFMPFDALKGLKDEMKKKEKEKVKKPILDQEILDNLSYKLLKYKKRDYISLEYYEDETIKKIDGFIENIEFVFCFLVINNKKINFENIISII